MGENSCQPFGLRPKSRAPQRGAGALGDATAEAQSQSRVFGALYVPLRGRIQACSARNLLRPSRDTSSAGLLILAI